MLLYVDYDYLEPPSREVGCHALCNYEQAHHRWDGLSRNPRTSRVATFRFGVRICAGKNMTAPHDNFSGVVEGTGFFPERF